MKYILTIILLLTATHTLFANPMKAEIDYLINHISNLNGTFVRNNKEHTPKEAVKHIQKKYDHFKDKISTTEQFIELSATKSVFSGKKYVIKIGGNDFNSKEYLLNVLQGYRKKN